MTNSEPHTTGNGEVTHECPGRGEAVTQCCGRTPFELPRTDRLTTIAGLVTCRAQGSDR